MKKRTYRRQITYVPNICDNGNVFWLAYHGHRLIKFAGDNQRITSEIRRINKFEHWTRLTFRYWSF